MAKISKEKYPDLKDLFVYKLKCLYYIEQELVKALPKMAAEATDEELKDGLEKHLEETKEHVSRIEECFKDLEIEPEAEKVAAIDGLIEDAESMMKMLKVATVKDASIISAATNVEHYEMAVYGTAVEWASLIEHEDIKERLEETLDEEDESADTLMTLGGERLFQEALGDSENTEEEE